MGNQCYYVQPAGRVRMCKHFSGQPCVNNVESARSRNFGGIQRIERIDFHSYHHINGQLTAFGIQSETCIRLLKSNHLSEPTKKKRCTIVSDTGIRTRLPGNLLRQPLLRPHHKQVGRAHRRRRRRPASVRKLYVKH